MSTLAAAVSVLQFPIGLPGFPEAHEFTTSTWGGEGSPFVLLTCAEPGPLQFVAVPPGIFFPTYQPEIDPQTWDALELADGEAPEVLVIVTLGATPEEATANLLGPLVVNARRGIAAQAVLAGRRWHPRTPLRSSDATAR